MNITVGPSGNYWYYVRPEVEGTREGWMSSDVVKFQPSQNRYGTLAGVRGSRINVRSAPRLSSQVRHYGLVGDLVLVEDSYQEYGQARWYRVRFPSNAIGWVREDLISVWPKGCIIVCPDN